MKPGKDIIGLLFGMLVMGLVWCVVMFGVIWFFVTTLRYFDVIP